MHPSDEKFLQSKLPQRKLEIALKRLFSEDTLSPGWQKTYTDYIRTRIYPALLLLAGQKEYGRMRRLLATGWADKKLRLRLLQEEQIRDVQIRAMLLAPEQISSQRIRANINTGAGKPPFAPALLTLWGRRLSLEHPALRNVLASMRFQEVQGRQLPGTDGETIFYYAAQLEDLAVSGMGYATYLHMVLHCLFFHILPPADVDRPLWDLACDAAAKVLAKQMFPGQFSDPPQCDPARRAFDIMGKFGELSYDIEKKLRALLGVEESFPLASAPAIYHLLQSQPERAKTLIGQFVLDDHSRWGQPQHTNSFSLQPQSCRLDMLRKWARAACDRQGSAKASPHFGLMPGSRQDRMEKKEEGQYNFGRYLKRFSITGEEMQLDTDSFDYIPYHYGMEHYGNLPFLEPLEYTETNKVEELVIAIDTSGSCSLQLVRRFLGETRKMLTEKEHFFTRMRVHIFQCDSMIQDYRLIHSREEWRRYEDRLSIAGRGGTNFTPVFDRVGKMLEAGSIKKLKGLLYFSDGDGVYPREKPPFETAFIFPDFRFLELKIPEWVVKICLERRTCSL